MAPWSTRRLTFLLLVVLVLSLIVPPVPSGLAQDAETPEVAAPTATDVPPPEPAPALTPEPTFPPPVAPTEQPVPTVPVDAPAAADEEVVQPSAFPSRQSVETSLVEEPSAEPGSLTMVVTDLKTSAPIGGAVVSISGVGSGVTGQDGRFFTGEIAVGQYYVEATADGYIGNSGWFDVSGVVEYTLSLQPAPQPGTLTVTVTDSISGDPIAGALVTVTWPAYVMGTTDEYGIWVSGELPGGTNYIEVSAYGYLIGFTQASVDGGTFLDVSLEKIPGGMLTVDVLDRGTGLPVAGASVTIFESLGNSPVAVGTTDANGLYVSDPLPGGEYNVEVTAESFFTGVVYPSVSGDTFVSVELEPVPFPGVLTVTVLVEGATVPIPGAAVTVYDSGWNVVASGASESTGNFVTGELAGGYFFVEVNADGFYGRSDWISVSGATEHTFYLKPLPKPGMLTVTVVDGVTDEPVVGASVTVTWPTYVAGVTDGNGVWVSGELPAGFTYVEVSAGGYLARYTQAVIDGATSLDVSLDPLLPGILTVEVVDRASSEPVAGASVRVYEYWGHVYVTEGTTGDDGLFTTSPLPGGDYAIEVTAASYYDGFATTFLNGDTAVRVDLEPLPLPGVLTVTVMVEGTSDPVSWAEVKVYGPGWTVIASGSTDEFGQLVTQELPPGYYDIDASKQGYQNGFSPVQVNGNSAVTVTMRPVPVVSVSLHVTDQSTGMPMPGVAVSVRDGYSDVEVASGVTDGSGVAIIEIPGGGYRFAARADGYYTYEGASYVFGPTDLYVNLAPRVAGEITVHVVDPTGWQSHAGAAVKIVDGDSGAEIVSGITGEDGMFPAGVLEGGDYLLAVSADGYVTASSGFRVNGPNTLTVILERAPGILTLLVTDAVSSQPVAGATITLHSTYGQPYDGGSTDADGYFVSGQLPGGSYLVEATAYGYLYASITVGIRGDTFAGLTMEPTLPGVLTLLVVDQETGMPIRGAWVMVQNDMANGVVAAGETDKDGRFLSETLPSGYYGVTVTAEGYDEWYSFPFVNGPKEITASLRPQMPGTLTVLVADAVSGEPIAKASVLLYDDSWIDYTTGKTDSSGEFKTGELGEGDYYIEIMAAGYFPVRTWAWVQGDTVREFAIMPRVPGALTVMVVDQVTRLPISDADVHVYSMTRTEVESGQTDATGAYTSNVLEPGDYFITITAEGYLPSVDRYQPVNGDTVIEVGLESAMSGTISVYVVGWDTYMGLPGATVIVRDATTGEEVERGLTNDVGGYTTAELAGGDYLVRVTADGYQASTAHVRLNGFAMTTVLLDPGEPLTPGSITLTLYSLPSGQPISGATVVVIDPDDLSEVANGTTDALGMFVTEDLPPGDFMVQTRHEFHWPSSMTIIVDGPVGFSLASEMQSTATLRVVPYVVQSGERVTVTGEGFTPSETIRIYWNVPGGEPLAELKATKDGTFSQKVTVPDGAEGLSGVVAVGVDSGNLGAWSVIVTTPGEVSLTP